MKHSVFFKLTVAAVAALLFTGCVEHEEIAFEGMIVGTRNCSGFIMDNNIGFIVKLFSPDSIGGPLTSTEGERMTNVVVLHEPPRLLYVGDTIHGTFYLDDKYSRVNSCVIWDNEELNNLPEGVFLKVVVD